VIMKRLNGPIARRATGTLLLQAFHTGVRFAVSLALAHMLGATGYGAYMFAMACVAVLSVPARLGFDSFMVREVAHYRALEQWGCLRGLLRRAYQSALVVSIVLAFVAAGAAWALTEYFEPRMVLCFWIGLLSLPLMSLQCIVRATMMGLQNTLAAQVPDMLVQPILFAVLLGLAAILRGAPVTAPVVVALGGVSTLVALLAAFAYLRVARPEALGRARPEYAVRASVRSTGVFISISAMTVLGASVGVIMLGSMSGPTAAGIFGITNAAAALIALPLAAINTPLAPALVAVFADGNKIELQRLATRAARSAFLLSLPLGLIYILFGEHLLRIFGEDFAAGHAALVILTVGQVINAAMGSVGVLLQMTGQERDVAVAHAFAVALNVVFNLIAIPIWGVVGAALGAAVSMTLWNVILSLQVRRRLAIRPTAMG
jgi:O-antigen/teichoic acid export membrane protein